MNRPRLHPSAYTIAWVSALPIESAAAAEMVDEEHCDPRDYVSNTDQYGFGRVGAHNVVMARLPSGQMGNNTAAAVIARLTAVFTSIRFALMVGIGGGVPSAGSDIRLGDVVVSHPHLQHGGVVQYDFGKTGPKGKTMRTGVLDAPPKVVLNAIAKLRENHLRHLSTLHTHLSTFDRLQEFSRRGAGADALFKATYNHIGGESCNRCDRQMMVKRAKRHGKGVEIHYGTIASGNQVMKDGVTRDRISAELGGVLCFEMEAAGLAGAFSCAVIRGICDYADSHKNKGWQPYAAATAAAVAKELLMVIPSEEVDRANTATNIIESEKYRVPFSLKGMPVGRFADRPKDMQRLEQVLLPQQQAGDCRRNILVLDGLGGIGKTQLAIEFARKHEAKFTSVFWLDGGSEDTLKQSIASCAGRIPEGQIPETSRKYSSSSNGSLDTVVRDFKEWLSKRENKHWLLIFDNVDREYQRERADDDAYDINDYIPDVDHGSVLVTTRLTSLQQLGNSLHLESVDMSQARAIFQKWYNHDFDPDDSDELLQLLDGLPLALAQAAAYMNEIGMTFSTYTRLYKEQWSHLMENENTAPLRSYGYRSIKTTWTMSYNAIRAKNEAATNLLLLWAHLDNKTFPFWMLQAGANSSQTLAEDLSEWLLDASDNEVRFFEVVRLLRSYGLVENLHGSSTHSTHPVVHQWAFHIQNEYQRAELSRLAAVTLGYAIPDENSPEYHPKQQQLLPHAEAWIERMEQRTENTDPSFSDRELFAIHNIGTLFSDRGNLGKAEKMLQRALEGYEKIWSPNHVSILATVNNLGNLYTKQGKMVKAKELYLRALEGYEETFGPNNNLALDTLNNLGLLYAEQGKLDEAEEVYQRALDGKERAFGPDHSLTLDTVNNLGNLYKSQGKLVKAKESYLRALEGYEKFWGPNHTSTLDTVNNIGLLYADQGKLEEAEEMFQRALDGKERAWGPDHTLTLGTVHNMGTLYKKQGKLAASEEMYKRALEGYENAVGPQSILTFVPALNSAYGLGVLLEGQGRLSEARLMYTRALNGYKEVFGTSYHWYRAAHEHLQDLKTSSDSKPASPTVISRPDRQTIDMLEVEQAGSTTSKRYRLLRKLILR